MRRRRRAPEVDTTCGRGVTTVGAQWHREHMLSVKDRMRLRLAGAVYKYPAQRENDARELLGETPPTFWLRVDQSLDDPAAIAEEPQIVHRLRRLRDVRANQRSSRQAS